ncbi:hypothetical protein B0H17DRAFT_1058192 [Mycena rosella]|uniref:Uncharacterized protein n=1 Tax=Mycena rosella TaxID=1033263 RepID=A0AAD7DLN4_MYCRO|nr:hypothetical protein B0H17DRAFT_1058192 [Mycena rosella]
MAEPAWANLLYTPNETCFECDTKTKYIDFALRRRLCLGCRKDLIRFKPKDKRTGLGFNKNLFDLVPYTETGGSYSGRSGSYQSYWRPDLEAMQIKVDRLQQKSREEYNDFLKTRTLEVADILDSAKDLQSWHINKKRVKDVADERRRDDRYNDIVERLVAAGYRRDEITRRLFSDEKGVEGVTRLTDEAWANIELKLKEILDFNRAERIKGRRRVHTMSHIMPSCDRSCLFRSSSSRANFSPPDNASSVLRQHPTSLIYRSSLT